MRLCVRVVRGLALSLLGPRRYPCRYRHCDGCVFKRGRSADRQIHRGGRQPACRSRDDPFLFPARPRRPARPARKSTKASRRFTAPVCFPTFTLAHRGGRLVVSVVENPVINQVAFEGNKKAKDEQLQAEVQSKPRGTLSKPTVQADVQRIIEIYHRSGRFDVTRRAENHQLPNNRVNLVFEIKEGEQDRCQGNRLRRRPCLLAWPAEGRHQDHGKQLAELPADHRHLRSGPRRSRP